ncbi:ATP-binding protein [Alcaligenaceae bacterium]|nr:ATP-binding protein [Alcaligenaceae bacterium]
MAIQLKSTREAARTNGLKVLVYGGAGAGKTTLCKTMPGNPIIISAEGGLLSLRDVDLPVIEVSKIEDVHEAYNYLMNDADGKKFDWIALDSISEIAEVVLSYEKKNSKDARAAYGNLSEQMTDLLRAFRDLPGRNVYMSCKMERVKDEHTGAMLYSPSLPGAKLAQGIPYLFDEVLCLRAEKDPEGKLVRYLQTQPDFNYIAKDRSGALDAFELPNLADIAAKVLATPDQQQQASAQPDSIEPTRNPTQPSIHQE